MRRILVVLVLALAATAAAQDRTFTLGLEAMPLTPRDARTQTRLAQWNSPMGRVQYEMSRAQAGAGFTGLVGGATPGIAFRVKVQEGLPLHLVSAVNVAGVQLHEQEALVIRWPWEKDEKKPEPPPLDEQISRQLERRLGLR